MWPFRKKRSRDRDIARVDSHSLGNLLLRSGMITVDDLRRALEHQDDNPDHMLGEALLVVVETLDRGVVEAFLAVQQIEDGQRSPSALDKVVHLAKNRKKPLYDAHARVVAAALSVVDE